MDVMIGKIGQEKSRPKAGEVYTKGLVWLHPLRVWSRTSILNNPFGWCFLVLGPPAPSALGPFGAFPALGPIRALPGFSVLGLCSVSFRLGIQFWVRAACFASLSGLRVFRAVARRSVLGVVLSGPGGFLRSGRLRLRGTNFRGLSDQV